MQAATSRERKAKEDATAPEVRIVWLPRYSAARNTRRAFIGSASTLAFAVGALLAADVNAQNATWTGAADSNWLNAGNWNPAVPSGTATFDATGQTTTINITDQTSNIGTLAVQAPGYTVNITATNTTSILTINGAGIQSSLSNRPTIRLGGVDALTDFAVLSFEASASAGNARIVTANPPVSLVRFLDQATAANATISFAAGASVWFNDSSTAGNATISAHEIYFNFDLDPYVPPNITHNASAGSATITVAESGIALFYGNSSGGTARFILNNAEFDISGLTSNGATVGSIEGTGFVALGSKNLEIGLNNLDTTLAAQIVDGGREGGTGGSLTKVGTGTLTLTGDNTYTGGTTILGGTLSVSSDLNLGDPIGELTFNGGILQVTGTSFTSTERIINWGHNGGGFDIVDADNTFTVSQALAGTGGLTKLGAGTLALTGTNAYTGPTTILDGTLQVDGSIQSQTTVQAPGKLAGNGTIFNDVINLGTVAPGASIGTLTIVGNYIGNGGKLEIEAELGGNDSLTDKLVISGGAASGTTGIVVVNLDGPGAMTSGKGIPIVIAENGATTAPGTFRLTGPVAAGPFQYLLFRGPGIHGGTAEEHNTWYLRSHFDPDPADDDGGIFDPDDDGGGNGGGGGPIPIYRPETASYALFPALARSLAVSTIGSFHERNGDQALTGGSKRERMWGRIFGAHMEQSHGGHVTPSFEGHAAGFQAGADAYETMWENGMRGRAGVFVGWAEARGDIKGFVLGQLQAAAGDAQLEATSVGGYGTLIGPGGWYIDGIVMPSFYSGDGRSTNGIGVNADGWSLLGSLEAGIPFRLGGGFTLEPQAQLIYQHLDFDDAADPFSTVRFNTPDAVSGRIGVRLAAELAGGRVRPYLKANIWQDWLDKDGVIYAGTHRLDTEHGGTAVEVGGGMVAELMPGVGLWGVVDYTTDIAGDTERETWRGNAGVRITW